MNNSLRELTGVFKALGDRNRFRIVKMLQKRPLCVCEIREVLGISQPAVSRHLNILKNAGLLEDKKVGIWTNCRLPEIIKNEPVSAILKYLEYRGNKDGRIILDGRKVSCVNRKNICARKFRTGKKKRAPFLPAGRK
jgi:ArsR family transcriptional regulator, arsenate/arsenite/antimonite-responsive transcriptional repressor